MTIMNRVIAALSASGNEALAGELDESLTKINELVHHIGALNQQAKRTSFKYIHHVQSHCEHRLWALSQPPEDTRIACPACGISVAHPKLYAWGEHIRKGGHWMYEASRSGRFMLDKIRRDIARPLIEEAINATLKQSEVPEATLPSPSPSVEGREAERQPAG